MIKNNGLSGYRILVIAIFISLGWHLFWLSAVKIVSAPARTEPVKFSKVSFLGPILTKVGVDFRVQPASRSFLEKRFASGVSDTRINAAVPAGQPAFEGGAPDSSSDRKMSSLIDEAVSGTKLVPDFGSD
jgi:hypothetical protein